MTQSIKNKIEKTEELPDKKDEEDEGFCDPARLFVDARVCRCNCHKR